MLQARVPPRKVKPGKPPISGLRLAQIITALSGACASTEIALEQLRNCSRAATLCLSEIRVVLEEDFGRGNPPGG